MEIRRLDIGAKMWNCGTAEKGQEAQRVTGRKKEVGDDSWKLGERESMEFMMGEGTFHP